MRALRDLLNERIQMKPEIHPEYTEVSVTCTSCDNVFVTRSTYGKPEMSLDVCSECHPFYTGKQKKVSSGGQVDKFRQRYKKG